jgi:hypothetical protein
MFKNDLVRIGLVILAGLLLLQLLKRNPSASVSSPSASASMRSAERMTNEYAPAATEQMSMKEEMTTQLVEDSETPVMNEAAPNEDNVALSDDVALPADMTNEGYEGPVESSAAVPERPKDCFPKDTLSADDLLPQDKYSKWAEVNPEGAGELKDRNFLEAGWHHGVNTVGQSLRNANYQLRSEPANPQVKVSPWLQSTIGPDLNRRPLEIGGQ